MTIDFSVTLHTLILGNPDSTTGWYAKSYTTSTIKMIIQLKGSPYLHLTPGVFVRNDAVGLTQDVVVVGDEIYYPTHDVYYEVHAVRPHYLGDSFYYYECDLVELPFHE